MIGAAEVVVEEDKVESDVAVVVDSSLVQNGELIPNISRNIAVAFGLRLD